MILKETRTQTIFNDLTAGTIVFFVALPLCLGIALTSGAPLFSGILGGVIGGILVGALSGSSTSISGPAAALAAVVAMEMEKIGSFEAFLTATILAGVFQLLFGLFRLGFISTFFPSSVIKGLLWAIGIILVLKQFPHLLGNDGVPVGDAAFFQKNNLNTFSEIEQTFLHLHYGATFIGLFALAVFFFWNRIDIFKRTGLPAPLAAVLLSTLLGLAFSHLGGSWNLSTGHLVQVPVAHSLRDSLHFLTFPDFSVLQQITVYQVALTLALITSLETLLNLEVMHKIDPLQRYTSSNRELFAQGVGNMAAGFIGSLPIASVIIRSSVNIKSGAKTKISAIWHGILLLTTVLFIPEALNKIPLSALAAILIVFGFKLAKPQIVAQMWREGKNQFLPFALTVLAIILTDLLTGVAIGLAVATGFILHSNIKRPLKKTLEKHVNGEEVLHIELANQMSFFNRASLESTFQQVPKGGHVLINAANTDYIDPDILDLIEDFQKTSSARAIQVSLSGFKDRYPQLEDRIQYVDFTSRALQEALTPERVLEILQEGNERFRSGTPLTRDLGKRLDASSAGQFPLAVVLSCIDSRAPVELIFDLSIGDIFSIRVAGNIDSRKILGSIEYACAMAGAKLVLVMGHTSCGAVRAAVETLSSPEAAKNLSECVNLGTLIGEIQESISKDDSKAFGSWNDTKKMEYLDSLAYKNVLRTMENIRQKSPILREMAAQKRIALVGAIYDISSAKVAFFSSNGFPQNEKKSSLKTTLRKFFRKNQNS